MRSGLRHVREHHVYFIMIALLLAGYLYCVVVPARGDAWGFSQFRQIRPSVVYLVLAAVGVALADLIRGNGGGRAPGPDEPLLSVGQLLVYALVAVAFVGLFWLFRSQFLNPDGRLLTLKIPRDVAATGAHLKHDEIMELFVHSRFWYLANRRLGWSVVKSYQVLSVLAGGLAVFLLLMLTRLLLPRRSLMLFLLMISAGYMQLFFGDVENYTLVTTLMLFYLLASHLFLSGRASIVVPSAILAVAICFHVLAGWLLPSLAYLYFLAAQRRQFRAMAGGIALSTLIVVGTLLAFHFSGLLPIQGLLTSHLAGDGRGYSGMLAPLSIQYYWEIANLLFLLFPGAILILPLLAFGRIGREREVVFLGVAGGCMLAFMLVWRAGLGVYYDWNLFAPGMIPLALLCFYHLLRNEQLRHSNWISFGILTLSMLHSYSWIISNHYFQP